MSDYQCQPREHDFAPFDAARGMCRKCGAFTSPPDIEWVDRLIAAIQASAHVCTHVCPVPYTTTPYLPPLIWSSGTTTSPDLGTITVWNGPTA